MVNPKIWGADGWYFIHMLAVNFRTTHISFYRELLTLLQFTLPCTDCQTNFAKHLQKYPVDSIVDAASMSQWGLHLQNEVNISLGKPTITNYELPPPNRIKHARIVNFFNIMAKYVNTHKNKTSISAARRIRVILFQIFPCLPCRNRIIKVKPRNFAALIKIIQK